MPRVPSGVPVPTVGSGTGQLSERESAVSASLVRSIVHAAEQRGASRAQLLAALRLTADAFERLEGRIALSAFYELCERAVAVDPALGLHWGHRLGFNRFGLLGNLVENATTLRSALVTLDEFRSLVQHEPSYHVLEGDEHVTIVYEPAPGAAPQAERFVVETVVFGFWQLVTSFALPELPLLACFTHAEPEYGAEYGRVFGGAERFGHSFSGLVFERKLMDAVCPYKDEDVYLALRAVAQRRLLHLTGRMPFAVRARELLVKQGPGRVSMEKVARLLGLSGRTLRRRLAAEGTTYEQVSTDALAITAKQLLLTSQLTIQQASDVLGFSHSSAFHRAFKRWTGMTPLEFRTRELLDQGTVAVT